MANGSCRPRDGQGAFLRESVLVKRNAWDKEPPSSICVFLAAGKAQGARCKVQGTGAKKKKAPEYCMEQAKQAMQAQFCTGWSCAHHLVAHGEGLASSRSVLSDDCCSILAGAVARLTQSRPQAKANKPEHWNIFRGHGNTCADHRPRHFLILFPVMKRVEKETSAAQRQAKSPTSELQCIIPASPAMYKEPTESKRKDAGN